METTEKTTLRTVGNVSYIERNGVMLSCAFRSHSFCSSNCPHFKIIRHGHPQRHNSDFREAEKVKLHCVSTPNSIIINEEIQTD
jgi:hypothetical protein